MLGTLKSKVQRTGLYLIYPREASSTSAMMMLLLQSRLYWSHLCLGNLIIIIPMDVIRMIVMMASVTQGKVACLRLHSNNSIEHGQWNYKIPEAWIPREQFLEWIMSIDCEVQNALNSNNCGGTALCIKYTRHKSNAQKSEFIQHHHPSKIMVKMLWLISKWLFWEKY